MVNKGSTAQQQQQAEEEMTIRQHNRSCCCLSVNSLPTIWYGTIAVLLQAYIIVQGGKTFWQYTDSKYNIGITEWERNLYISLQGTALLLLPILAFASTFKLGNLANDGFRLGRRLDLEMDLDLPRSRHRDPLIISGSACGAAWRHCPPLGPSIHAIAALCSLVAKMVLEARFIKDGLISRDRVWNTDLDFVFLHSLWPEKGVSAAELVRGTPLPSPEFISYSLALLVFGVRCSDVYWGVNKCLSFLISLQLVANALSALLMICGASILYKVELIGIPASLSGVSGSLSEFLLLDPPITIMLLMLLSSTLLLACSPLSMYALNKLSAFLIKTRKRYMQDLPAARSYLWSFYPHLAALATLLAIAACCAPILHDISLLYKLNPQPMLMASVTGSIVHAFLWVALWLFLTAKTNWDFRLKISIGRTWLKSPSCLALTAQIDFKPHHAASEDQQQSGESESLLTGSGTSPMLVLAGGKAYSLTDGEVQRKIQQVIGREQQVNSSSPHSGDKQPHQVYWLHGNEARGPAHLETSSPSSPTLPEPCNSVAGESSSRSGMGSSISEDYRMAIECGSHHTATSVGDGSSNAAATSSYPHKMLSPVLTRPVRKPLMRIPGSGVGVEEDGDYATLRDLPLVTLPEEPADMSHETSSSSDGADSGFGSGTKPSIVTLSTPISSPRLTRDLCNPYGYVKPKMITFAALPGQSNTIGLHPPILNNKDGVRQNSSPFSSLPIGHRPTSHAVVGSSSSSHHSVQVHRPNEPLADKRPAIQACLFAGQGLETSQRV